MNMTNIIYSEDLDRFVLVFLDDVFIYSNYAKYHAETSKKSIKKALRASVICQGYKMLDRKNVHQIPWATNQ